ncbi:Imidazolonepropionase [Cryptosporangium aurantiacum]|uniref:Imidazolonepropionase n=1 Tax=Cryptosporangium aurantiacum TaxID=134849 RepID=A0A1M7HVA4_9ACTN|nr:Imidazolonepropionase [Cryptosporangium aurantiacum]
MCSARERWARITWVTALHLRGVVLPDDVERDVWIVGDRLTFEPVPGASTVASGGFLLPGLVDAHCHPGIVPGGPVTEIAEAKRLALIDRDAGVLTIRDAGSPLDYRELDDDPDMPRLIRAGRHLAPHRRYIPGLAVECEPSELAAAAVTQAKLGNGWVKLVGDWIDRGAGDLGPTYDDATFAAAVTAAHDAGARVAVHTFSEAALPGLIAAGVDSIEHGTGLSLDLIDAMAAQRTALVPTMTNIATFDSIADRAEGKFPGYADHMRRLRAGFPAVVRAAYEAGVPIYVGTDAGGGVEHGLAAGEMLRLADAGMAPIDVLAAGSWGARAWLGLPAIEEGALADVVVYPEDPRTDLRVLEAPARIILRGRVVA